jgi:hypothetical protein
MVGESSRQQRTVVIDIKSTGQKLPVSRLQSRVLRERFMKLQAHRRSRPVRRPAVARRRCLD